jgi:hypothetical protein
MPEADPLTAVREAERLVREAQARAEAIAGEAERPAGAAAGDPPPPRGWEVPGAERASGSPFGDLAALAGLLDVARGAVPPELARPLADALRELLLALRAVIDFYLERLDRPEPPPVRVEDIPIE